ncbi:hypothetical protein G7Y89_g5821 [Cudoniella acicularis]|uniref:glucose-6-phosphate 1-epimerase n=1 Tax=Cudoniella acicularis TaxID=354080 RepID=A0A8H4RNY1_9HELO|nr:hypothetical protein G7Y89_g5821 [Cudoniella acicularis]
MVEPAQARTPLPTLTARPPTPPRESQHIEQKPNIFSRLLYGEPKARRASAPIITPNSSAESPIPSPNTSTSAIGRKKVEWSDAPDYKDPPRLSVDGKAFISHPVQPLTPSAQRKPSKSILKAYNGLQEHEYTIGTLTKLLPPYQHESFATMLESIVQQLAGGDRASKMDAYLMLSGSLKASENIPDVKALKDKMTLILQFIKRDMTERMESGKLDNPLMINALTLLSSFLQKPAIGEAFGLEFPAFMVDYCIRTFEDPHMSKDIVKHLMFVLAHQKFPQQTMNSHRVGKLIMALHNIDNLVKGKSIVMGRINVYRALLRQSRPHMLTHTIWIQGLFSDMISSLKEIRTLAITFGLEASLSLGNEGKLSKTVETFMMEESEGRKYADLYIDRLKIFLENKSDSPCVPQIWSVIILFFRSKPHQLEQWALLNQFFGIIQPCLNSGDQATKVEANYAWNRFVFAIRPNSKTKAPMIKTLSNPFVMQLKRKSSAIRKVVLGGVCNLLYYSLNPHSTPTELDLFWDEYVVALVGQCLTPTSIVDNLDVAQRNISDACHILQCMFDTKLQRGWSDSRAMLSLTQNIVETRELPALDSKWLRKSSTRVFPVLIPIMEKLYWDLGHESQVTDLWETYITSIASPAIMEVKVSNDTMSSIASMFSLLHRIWHTGPKSIPGLPSTKSPSSSEFLKGFENIVKIAVQGLGILPFTDRLLCVGKQDTFVPVATPSHRPEKVKGEVRSPLQHLLCLLTNISPDLEYDVRFSEMTRSILLPFFESRKSNQSIIELAKDLVSLLPEKATPACKILWRTLADFATTATDTRDKENSSNLEQPLGADYRSVIRILESGIGISPHEPLTSWKTLFRILVNSVTLDVGDAGRAIVVVEPLSKFLVQYNSKSAEKSQSTGFSYFHILLLTATYPKDRQALDAARKRLWGVVNPGSKAVTFDPYTQFYEYVRDSLQVSYASYNKRRLHEYSDIISAMVSLLGRCPGPLLLGMLVKIQEGIAPWILDKDLKLNGGTALSKEIATISDKLCALIAQVENHNTSTKVLADLEILICSGLESSHKSIASKFIKIWNGVFGSAEDLQYPEHVKDALLRLRQVADLRLPFFPESLESEEMINDRQPVTFVDTQEDSSNFMPSASTESVLKKHQTPLEESSPMRRLRQTTPQVIIPSMRKRPREETPEIGKRKSQKRAGTPKLRHDDSQIQFHPVESSPILGSAAESQILTDRQKEVKERQQAESAMFPDLRSSPQPKGKAQAGEPELPFHRSSSKSRTRSPSQVPQPERQATPTPVPASEDDNFMVSSPTPKRENHHNVDLLAPPSSPPEAVPSLPLVIDRGLGSRDDFEVPSSPPEVLREPEHDGMTSVEYPSAQIDSCAGLNIPTMSTYQSTAQTESHLVEGDIQPSATKNEEELHPSNEHAPAITTAEELDQCLDLQEPSFAADAAASGLPLPTQDAQAATTSEDVLMEDSSVQPPSTPDRQHFTGAEAAGSPPYEDAKASPASSDQNTANEDVFEDAVTSPRMIIQEQPTAASSFNEFDDSSILRVMEHIENQALEAATPAPQLPQAAQQTKRVSPRKSSLYGSMAGNSPSRGSMRIAALKNATAIESGKILDQGKEEAETEQSAPPSSMASLIPETPAAKMPSVKNMIVVDGEELDLEDTIIVDTAAWEEEERAFALKKSRKRGSIGSRKRKISGMAADDSNDSEVPDSQEHLSQSLSPKHRSSRKKQRGRPKGSSQRSSQLSQEIQNGFDLERSQSILSADLDASMQDVSTTDKTTDAVSRTIQDSTELEEKPSLEHVENVVEPQVMATAVEPPSSNLVDENAKLSIRQKTTEDVEMVMETTIDETTESFAEQLQKQLEAEQQPEIEREVERAETSTTESVLPGIPVQKNEVSVEGLPEENVQEVAPTFGSVQSKLQSLVRDLALVAFSRQQSALRRTTPHLNIMVDRPKKPSALSTTPGPTPQAQVNISHSNSRVSAVLPTGEAVEILLYGATIVSWKDAKGNEKLWLSEKAKTDGSKAVRGGIPLVFPVFGKAPDHAATAKLPQHGFARTSKWEFLGKSTSESSESKDGGDSSVKLDFGLSSNNLNEESKKAWPYDFGLIYSVTLGKEGLTTSMVVRNEGETAWEFQVLMHSYLRIQDISAIAITGLESSAYIDKVTVPISTTTSPDGPVTISGTTDRVYTPAGGANSPVTVSEGGKKKFVIVRDNLNEVVVWNPWVDAKNIGDFAPEEGYKEMICVEAGAVKGWQKLEAGETWEGGQIITASN